MIFYYVCFSLFLFCLVSWRFLDLYIDFFNPNSRSIGHIPSDSFCIPTQPPSYPGVPITQMLDCLMFSHCHWRPLFCMCVSFCFFLKFSLDNFRPILEPSDPFLYSVLLPSTIIFFSVHEFFISVISTSFSNSFLSMLILSMLKNLPFFFHKSLTY